MERLAPQFVAEAPRWGVQDGQRWTQYATWMFENKLIQKPVDGLKAFTNDFLAK